MGKKAKATVRSDHATTRTPRRRPIVRGLCAVTTKATGSTPGIVRTIEVRLAQFWSKSWAGLNGYCLIVGQQNHDAAMKVAASFFERDGAAATTGRNLATQL